MTTVLEAKTAMRDLAVKAQSIVADDTRTLASRREELDKVEADLKSFSEVIALHDQATRIAAGGGGDSAPSAKAKDDDSKVAVKSLGQQVTDSDAYQIALKSAGNSRFSASVDVKTIATINEGTTFSGGFPTGLAGPAIMPDFRPGIVDLRFRRLVVADLMASSTTSSNSISYVVESQFQNSAAGVAEGGAKPQSDDTLVRATEQVGKIAHFAKMTDEMIADAPYVRSFVENRMVFGVQLKEDTELLTGAGYPSVPGLLGRSGMQTAISKTTGTLAAPTLVMEAIYNQMTAIRFNAFVEPEAILANPTDWQNIRLAKDANNQYYAGGPFTGAYGNGASFTNVDALWGLPVVLTPAIAAGTLLVGGFRQCAEVIRRQGITLEMTNSHVDDFTNNLITVRAEERLALAVWRPGGFGKVTVTWA